MTKAHASHETRVSMSSHYDMICDVCGVTDGYGHEQRWKTPCVGVADLSPLMVRFYTLFGVKTAVSLLEGTTPRQVKWCEFGMLIASITYKPGWYFRAGVEGTRMWYQVGVTKEAEISFDPIEGTKVPWRGAKHYLSEHMCRNEIVTGVKHAIDRAEMHEVNEWFRYKGKSIYNPHLDPDSLVEVAKYAKNFNTRENAMTMDN